jgi:hypothetical protein
MEFTEKKVYLTMTWNIGGTNTGSMGPEAHDYTLDGKRVLIDKGNIYDVIYRTDLKEGIYIFQTDSSLTTTPPMKNPIIKSTDIKLFKK